MGAVTGAAVGVLAGMSGGIRMTFGAGLVAPGRWGSVGRVALPAVPLMDPRGGQLVALLAGRRAAGRREAVRLMARGTLLVSVIARDRSGAAQVLMAARTAGRRPGRRVGGVTAATGTTVGVIASLKRQSCLSVARGAALSHGPVTVGLVAGRAGRMGMACRSLMTLGAGTVLRLRLVRLVAVATPPVRLVTPVGQHGALGLVTRLAINPVAGEFVGLVAGHTSDVFGRRRSALDLGPCVLVAPLTTVRDLRSELVGLVAGRTRTVCRLALAA